MPREARKIDRVWESTSRHRIDRHFGSDRRSKSPLKSRVDATLRWCPSYFCGPSDARTGFDGQVEFSPPAGPAVGEWLSALGEAAERGRPRIAYIAGDAVCVGGLCTACIDTSRHEFGFPAQAEWN